MGGVVRHPEFLPDDLGNSSLGPHCSPETMCLGSTFQEPKQLLALGIAEPQWGARGLAPSQRLGPLLLGPLEPLADGSFGDPQGCGDFLLPPPLLAQLPGTQASSFPPIGCMG